MYRLISYSNIHLPVIVHKLWLLYLLVAWWKHWIRLSTPVIKTGQYEQMQLRDLLFISLANLSSFVHVILNFHPKTKHIGELLYFVLSVVSWIFWGCLWLSASVTDTKLSWRTLPFADLSDIFDLCSFLQKISASYHWSGACKCLI